MAKGLFELVISVIANLQQLVFDPKRTCRIVTHFLEANLRRPTVQIFAIEQLNPLVAAVPFRTS